MPPRFDELLHSANEVSRSADNPQWSAYCRELTTAPLAPDRLPTALATLADVLEQGAADTGPARERLMSDRFWATVLERLWRGITSRELSESLTHEAVAQAAGLYRGLGRASRARHQLLRLLAASGEREALWTFSELMVSEPPNAADEVILSFVPLFQSKTYPPDALFPRLLDALHDATLATVVLDLANHLTRSGRVTRHPAAERVDRLSLLLGGVVTRLAKLEERPDEFARSPGELNQIVSDSTGLVVALTNALALIGDPSVTGKLHQTLELSHRRIRTEAASALATLGDERGTDVLVEMAAEPVVRLRALATLDDLGYLDKVPERHRSAEARAEAELAVRLALPTYFGTPPHRLELVDFCRQPWPGYAQPVDCYLFRYEYRFGERLIEGIGMAGPIVHAFRTDLADLPPNDIYAAYAGWATEHDEIEESDELNEPEQAAWTRRRQELAELGYEEPQFIKVGRFFGQTHYVAAARLRDQPGVLVDDGLNIEWFSGTGAARSVSPDEAYYIVKGRKLLRGRF
ncbi:MAG TPA: HEAT repeat domain-containing protein [Pirellulales bacterium]|nr:HEAT repeat domain-containing protein [Pirellulales bacterium]